MLETRELPMAAWFQNNGYIAFRSDLFRAFLRAPITGLERQIAGHIMRMGFDTGTAWVSLSVSEMATEFGVTSRGIMKAASALEEANIIAIRRTPGEANSYRFNPNYSSWAVNR